MAQPEPACKACQPEKPGVVAPAQGGYSSPMKKRAGRQAKLGSGTVLSKYQRLEAIGLWRETPEEQRREVIVHLGEATLVMTDPRSEVALTHWSLPAVQRINPGEEPALFSPGSDSGESVEIEDEAMLAALRTVHSAVVAARPHPGRLRGALIGGGLTLALVIAALVVPAVLISHTTAMVPVPKRAELGMRALDDVVRLTGAPCDSEFALPALARLSERVFGPEDTPILYILPEGLTRPAHLPGGVILLPKSLIEQNSPDALAGAALVEGISARLQDPLRPILEHAGITASFELLTSGDLPASALSGYGEDFLGTKKSLPPQSNLIAAFSEAQLSLTPWARWLGESAGSTEALIAADPYRERAPAPLMADDDWMALQSVCAGS